MGNFCIGDEGVNGIADRKHKKISSLGSSFLPKGLKGKNGDPWEEIFFMLKVCNSIYAQVTYAEIAFIHRSILNFLNYILDILNIIIIIFK